MWLCSEKRWETKQKAEVFVGTEKPFLEPVVKKMVAVALEDVEVRMFRQITEKTGLKGVC